MKPTHWQTKNRGNLRDGKAFIRRPGIQKMILVLDGTWKQADLNALLRAGWDEIYYPDEMDQLAKAIV
jgi:hypothetical protein